MKQTRYEKRLDHSPVTRFLHSVRYRNLVRVVGDLARQRGGAPIRILDVGSGAGRAFAVLDPLFAIDYTGVEMRGRMCMVAGERFGDRPNFAIHRGLIEDRLDLIDAADLVIALETFEHMGETSVAQLLGRAAGAGIDTLYCTVPNEIGPAVAIKNIGSAAIGYRRHREYRWHDTFHAATYRLDKVPPHTGGHRGFDWRLLERAIRDRFDIEAVHGSPYDWVPRAVSPSIGFLCRPRAGQ